MSKEILFLSDYEAAAPDMLVQMARCIITCLRSKLWNIGTANDSGCDSVSAAMKNLVFSKAAKEIPSQPCCYWSSDSYLQFRYWFSIESGDPKVKH